jgi:carbamoyltransferase
MAALGDPTKYYDDILNDFFVKLPDHIDPSIEFKMNLHKGCDEWRPDLTTEQDYYDIAAATQKIFEDIFDGIMRYTKCVDTNNLILTGGTALNCVANINAYNYYKKVWIMPNPGDAGSSLGAILAGEQKQIKFDTAFLGHNIEGSFPHDQVLHELLTKRITAVASGRAEFGPRALGHRSILADPRGDDVKDRVNKIKHREPFRPFAPVILQNKVHEYFEVPEEFSSPFMQFTVRCKYPELFPAIVHYDNTSRVQTVTKKDNPDLYKLLVEFEKETGCPMLLNTSLNIKGEPLINTREDAERWTEKYGVEVCLPKLKRK